MFIALYLRKDMVMSSKKQAGFTSYNEYRKNLATSPSCTFASFTEYQKDRVKQLGFATVADYRNHLAQQRGFPTVSD